MILIDVGYPCVNTCTLTESMWLQENASKHVFILCSEAHEEMEF